MIVTLRIFFTIFVILLLFFVGYYVSLADCCGDSSWLPTWKYVSQLGANIGVSGFDALVVGGIAGYVSAEISAARKRRRLARRLALRRRLGRRIDLAVELKDGSSRLPLWGFSLKEQKVEDLVIDRAQFGGPASSAKASQLHKVEFIDCVMQKVSFSGESSCVLRDTSFVGSTLTNCDFQGVVISGDAVRDAFTGSNLVRCNFNRAVLKSVRFDNATLEKCSFWGAELEEALIDRDLYERLHALGAIFEHPSRKPGHVTIASRSKYLKLRVLAWWKGSRWSRSA